MAVCGAGCAVRGVPARDRADAARLRLRHPQPHPERTPARGPPGPCRSRRLVGGEAARGHRPERGAGARGVGESGARARRARLPRCPARLPDGGALSPEPGAAAGVARCAAGCPAARGRRRPSARRPAVSTRRLRAVPGRCGRCPRGTAGDAGDARGGGAGYAGQAAAARHRRALDRTGAAPRCA